jgi:hypothetical protein
MEASHAAATRELSIAANASASLMFWHVTE